jgi:glycosyltransferase involved in cell wall biosynthesis
MKIAIDISPIDNKSTSNHKVRGVGKYIMLLKDNLERFDPKNSYVFTSNISEVINKVDVIHYPYFDPFFITLPHSQKRTIVVTVHDVIPLINKKEFPVGIKGEMKWHLNRWKLKRTNGIITDSVASKEDIITVTGISERKIFPVHLAVDEDFRKLDIGSWILDIRKKYDLPEKFMLYVGDVTWNKNLPRIVTAIKKTNIPLVMVGKALQDKEFDKNNPWNKDRNAVLNLTEGDSQFIKLGFVPTDDLVRIYNMALSLLMPSLDEGFGLPVLEAMSCGCPVITSKNGSLNEVAGESVMYVDPENIEDISNAITKIVQEDKLHIKFSQLGIEQAKKFTLKKMIENTVAAYEKIYTDEKRV